MIVHGEPDVQDKNTYFYVYEISSKNRFLNSSFEELIQTIFDNVFIVNILTCLILFTVNIFMVVAYVGTALYCVRIVALEQYYTCGTILLQL